LLPTALRLGTATEADTPLLVANLKAESLRLRGNRTSAERQYEEKKRPVISMLENTPLPRRPNI
jgi:hypothetical protein